MIEVKVIITITTVSGHATSTAARRISVIANSTESDLFYIRFVEESERSSEAFRQEFFFNSVNAEVISFVTENYIDKTTCQKKFTMSQQSKYRQTIFVELSPRCQTTSNAHKNCPLSERNAFVTL